PLPGSGRRCREIRCGTPRRQTEMSEREPPRKDSRSSSRGIDVGEPREGEIRGAFGTIKADDRHPSRTWRQRLLTLAAIMGPGIIVLVGDNDAGGVATYAQAGQNAGYSLLWTLLLLVPVLIVNQEMVVRLGAVTFFFNDTPTTE